MRFMIIVRSPPEAEAGMVIAAFRGQLARAGVLLDAADLRPSRGGWAKAARP